MPQYAKINSMEGSPIKRIRDRITTETKDGVDFVIEKSNSRKEKVDLIIEQMEEKKMEKVHVAYALISSKLPFEHDFIQGYFNGDSDYFAESSYKPENLVFLEKIVNNFDIEKDAGKMWPTSN